MNVGARSISTSANYPSKAALRRALQADPSDVLFYSTSDFTPGAFRATEVPFGETLYVVGPDPYTSRKYFATATTRFTGAVPPGGNTVTLR